MSICENRMYEKINEYKEVYVLVYYRFYFYLRTFRCSVNLFLGDLSSRARRWGKKNRFGKIAFSSGFENP